MPWPHQQYQAAGGLYEDLVRIVAMALVQPGPATVAQLWAGIPLGHEQGPLDPADLTQRARQRVRFRQGCELLQQGRRHNVASMRIAPSTTARSSATCSSKINSSGSPAFIRRMTRAATRLATSSRPPGAPQPHDPTPVIAHLFLDDVIGERYVRLNLAASMASAVLMANASGLNSSPTHSTCSACSGCPGSARTAIRCW